MVPYVPCVPGIGIRGNRNRTKHNSDARGEDSNFTHRVALFVVPPALLVVGITPRARSGFRRATVTNDCAPQQRQHWLCEQVLNWSGLTVVHVRPTVFLQYPFFSQWAAESIARDSTIRLPFGAGRTSPIDAGDVAEVTAAILASPTAHIGQTYELTGPRSQDMRGVAAEYADALGRPITYVDVPFDQWRDQELGKRGLSEHLFEHFLTMARLHAANRYDRLTHDVEAIT
jgi:uncharacterized protein YbjT (DUF2867 family)